MQGASVSQYNYWEIVAARPPRVQRPGARGNPYVMDALQRSIYTDRFRLAFHTLKGKAFQDWFVLLAAKADG